jgi:hypothetical protein
MAARYREGLRQRCGTEEQLPDGGQFPAVTDDANTQHQQSVPEHTECRAAPRGRGPIGLEIRVAHRLGRTTAP